MLDGAQLAGPVIALAMIVILAMVLHRSLRDSEPAPGVRHARPHRLGSTRNRPRRPIEPAPLGPAEDYGLLAVAAACRTLADARLTQEHLRAAGIRATLAAGPDGKVQVLVFGDELATARRVVG